MTPRGEGRGENRSTQRKTSRSRVENQQQTQPTYGAETGNRTRATLVGGECSHHRATRPVLPELSLRWNHWAGIIVLGLGIGSQA